MINAYNAGRKMDNHPFVYVAAGLCVRRYDDCRADRQPDTIA